MPKRKMLVDLFVAGTGGMSGFQKLSLGSVALGIGSVVLIWYFLKIS
jgi:hypothetical protein